MEKIADKIKQLIWSSNDKPMPPWLNRFYQDIISRTFASQQIFYESLTKRLETRNDFAAKYLGGRGIELGAQQVPTKVSKKCQVEYVDVISNEQLVSRFGLPGKDLVPLSHVIDGNDLSVYRDSELNFVIANHVLEHFDDPVSGVCEWIRILKNGGRLFITLPNHRANSYDLGRVPARFDHLKLDFMDAAGRPARNFEHYVDFAKSLYQWTDMDALNRQAQKWVDADDRHHYHVYDKQTVKDVMTLAGKYSGASLRYVDGLLLEDRFEFLIILEKTEISTLVGWPAG
jgi:ubiquinone/menaquinone biosynthesis C-methylase UbiE